MYRELNVDQFRILGRNVVGQDINDDNNYFFCYSVWDFEIRYLIYFYMYFVWQVFLVLFYIKEDKKFRG